MRPAQLNVGPDIQIIVVVDRTKPSKKDKWINIGEGVLTGEGIMADRAAAQELVNSLKNNLQVSPRFQVIIAKERLEGNSLSSVFPNPIDQATQINLLRRYQADAIVALEIMDSDFLVTQGTRMVKKRVGEGDKRKEIEVKEWYAEGVGNLKVGLRFYYPEANELIDQELLSQTNTWRAAGENKTDALAALISREEATLNLCRVIGGNYAAKIAPMPVRLKRVFYTKAKESNALEEGGRLAEVGAWDEAIGVWEKGLDQAQEEKDRERIAYNIAVAYEVMGDLDQALAWAQKAYASYGSKQARTYAQQIQARMNDEQRVNDQMN